MMSDGIVFLPCVFLSALWFGRPPLTISITTLSSSSHHRAGKRAVYFSWAFWVRAYVRIIYPYLCNAQFVSSLIKHKCFSLTSFDVNSCVSSAAKNPHGVKRSFRQSQSGQMNSHSILKISQSVHTSYLNNGSFPWLKKKKKLQPTSGAVQVIKKD